MSNCPIAVTPGEPAGVGTEITLKAWEDGSCPTFFLIDDPERVKKRAHEAHLNTPINVIENPKQAEKCYSSGIPILPCKFPVHCEPGAPAKENAPVIIDAIEMAVNFVDLGLASAVVTNPIQKDILRQSGFEHPGHTEFLAHLSRSNPYPVMLLASPLLYVVPVTIHEPIKNVPELLTKELIIKTLMITANSLSQDFGIKEPRLCVSGLNPHAGENGTIGKEESATIKPAIEFVRAKGIRVTGPVAADSMFNTDARGKYDVAICMYHDQALIPLKTLDFWEGVNVTIGLPFVRTSPDHGTALDISGTGQASEASIIAAIKLANKIAWKRSLQE